MKITGKPYLAIRRRRRQQQFEHSRRILSSSSSQSLPLCSCVSVCCFFFTYSLLSSAFLFCSSAVLFFFCFSLLSQSLWWRTEDGAGFSFRIWVWVFALCVACVFLVFPLFFWVFLPCFCLRSLFFSFCMPLFCSAFYRARELAPKTSPCYSPAFTGLLINPRAGSWAKEVVHDRIELLPFSLLNRLSPREVEGIMNSSSKRRRLCPSEWLCFTLVPELLTFIN